MNAGDHKNKTTNLDFRFLHCFDYETVVLSEVKDASTFARRRHLSE